MKKSTSVNKQRGMAVGIVIGLVGVVSVLGAVIASSLGGSGTQSSSNEDKVLASGLMLQGMTLRDAWDQHTEADGAAPANVAELLTDGYLSSAMTPPSSTFSGANAPWANVGTGTVTHLMVAGIKESVCTEANTQLSFELGSQHAAANLTGANAATAPMFCMPASGTDTTKNFYVRL